VKRIARLWSSENAGKRDGANKSVLNRVGVVGQQGGEERDWETAHSLQTRQKGRGKKYLRKSKQSDQTVPGELTVQKKSVYLDRPRRNADASRGPSAGNAKTVSNN